MSDIKCKIFIRAVQIEMATGKSFDVAVARWPALTAEEILELRAAVNA